MKTYLNWVLLIIFLSGAFFCCSEAFVEKEVLPKGYILIFFSILLGSMSLLRNSQLVKFDKLTISVFAFVIFILFSAIVTNLNIITILSLIGVLFLFAYFRNNHIDRLMNVTVICLCVLQAGYGLLQYFHLIYISSKFLIVGSYDNPAGFAACLAVAFPLSFSLLRYPKYYRLLAIFSVIIIAIAIVLSQFRAGIISISIVSMIFIYSRYKDRLGRFKKSLILSFVIIGIMVFSLSLFLKKESASGRILIWNVTGEMIKDAPVLGHGNGAFLAKYMDYQADYFTRNPQSKYEALADNVLHPFNEYLLLITEYGFTGFVLLSVVVFLLFKYERISSPYMLCLLSLGVFSLFSYPLKYPFVLVVMVYCLARISKNQEPIYTFRLSTKNWFRFSVLACLFMGMYLLGKDIAFEYKWNRIAKASLMGETQKMLPRYGELYGKWNHNPLFLYNYGAELNHVKDYSKSIDILHECEKCYNDYDVQMLLADNYYNLKKFAESEKHYLLASHMCPNRFFPLYWLMKIYDEKGQPEEAKKIAKAIIDKDVKIPSATVTKIRIEASKRIENGIP